MSNFPNKGGSLLTIDDPTIDPHNPSCLSNNQTAVQYVGVGPSSTSSVAIQAGSLQPNRTYQFKIEMQNLRTNLSQATGYVLVQVVDTSSPIVAVG